MDLFELSEELINTKNKEHQKLIYTLFPQFSNKIGNEIFYSAINKLDRYYNDLGAEMDVGFQNSVVLREIIKNARWHGGSKDGSSTKLGLFLNPKKFVLGCNDGGDYFKREDIKDIWENKKELREFHEDDGPPGPHFGYGYFKTKFSEIKIDTKHGTFYGIVDTEKYF